MHLNIGLSKIQFPAKPPAYTAKGTQQFHTDTWLVTQPSTKNTNNSSWSQGYIPLLKVTLRTWITGVGRCNLISFLGRPPKIAMLVLGRVHLIVKCSLSNLIILTPRTWQVTGVFFGAGVLPCLLGPYNLHGYMSEERGCVWFSKHQTSLREKCVSCRKCGCCCFCEKNQRMLYIGHIYIYLTYIYIHVYT